MPVGMSQGCGAGSRRVGCGFVLHDFDKTCQRTIIGFLQGLSVRAGKDKEDNLMKERNGADNGGGGGFSPPVAAEGGEFQRRFDYTAGFGKGWEQGMAVLAGYLSQRVYALFDAVEEALGYPFEDSGLAMFLTNPQMALWSARAGVEGSGRRWENGKALYQDCVERDDHPTSYWDLVPNEGEAAGLHFENADGWLLELMKPEPDSRRVLIGEDSDGGPVYEYRHPVDETDGDGERVLAVPEEDLRRVLGEDWSGRLGVPVMEVPADTLLRYRDPVAERMMKERAEGETG